MPSFDIVSEVDMHEAANAVDQANREVNTRFDFKGSDATYTLSEQEVQLTAESEFQLQQMIDILNLKFAKRGIDIACLSFEKISVTGKKVQQTVIVRQGLDSDMSRDIVKRIKVSKIKVQAATQGEKVRVTGKKRDDLQQTIALLKEAPLELPLQYNNFRD